MPRPLQGGRVVRWPGNIPREAWVLFAVLPLLQLTIQGTGPVVPNLREAFDLSYGAVGIFLASLNLARLVANLPAGQLVAHFNGRALVAATAGLTILTCTLAAIATEYWQLLAARAFLGVVSALNFAVILAWLAGLTRSHNRGRIMALHDTAISVVAVFAPPLSGLLALQLSWRAAFVLGALGALAAGALILAFTRADEADAALRRVGRSPAAPSAAPPAAPPTMRGMLVAGGPLLFAAYALAFAVFFGRNSLLQSYLPLLGGVALDLSAPAIGLALGGLAALSTIFILGGGILSDRFGRAPAVLPGFGFLLATQASLLLITDANTYFVIVLWQAASFGPNALPPSLIGDALPATYRGLGMASYRFVADGAILLGPLVMGLALDLTGFTAPVLMLVAITALCALLAWLALRRAARIPSPATA